MMKQHPHNRVNGDTQAGFTLIETLVAVAVLIVSLVGPMALVQRSLNSAAYTREQITAFFLGQDAMELLTNIRDNDTKNGTAGFAYARTNCGGTYGCIMDTTVAPAATPANAISRCTSACPPMRKDSTGSFYGYNSSWGVSEYTRTIRVTQPNGNLDENLIEVILTWDVPSGAKTMTVSRIMYDFNAAKAKREAELES